MDFFFIRDVFKYLRPKFYNYYYQFNYTINSVRHGFNYIINVIHNYFSIYSYIPHIHGDLIIFEFEELNLLKVIKKKTFSIRDNSIGR